MQINISVAQYEFDCGWSKSPLLCSLHSVCREAGLYDAADPLSATRVKLNAERRQRNPISRSAARVFLERAAASEGHQ
jgi:hypothetical protein